MRVWDVVAAVLKEEGVEQLFCYPSTPLIDACSSVGIRPFICRQERVGVGMADGFARTTSGRRTAVFAMQSGPGSENAYPGVATAHADSSPVLLLPQGLSRERFALQPNFDSARAFAPVTKSFERITSPELTVPALRRAFHHLRSGRPGPVMVEIPSDIGDVEAGNADGYRPVAALRSAADPGDVDRAIGLMSSARRPLIFAGAGVHYAEAWDELKELAIALASPVVTSAGGKSAFPEDHALSLGVASLASADHVVEFVRRADLIFAVGASLTRGSILTPNLPSGAKLIHCSNDPRDIGKSYFVECGLVGDAKLVLRQLLDALKDRGDRSNASDEVAHEIKLARTTWMEKWKPRLQSEAVPIDSYRVIHEFMHLVDPADAVVTHDSGSPRDQLLPFYMATLPHSYMGWGKSHALGTGVGLSMGAKRAAPAKLCVHFMGDGAFGMTGLDLETAVRTGLPTLSIVFNNSAMAVERSALARSQDLYRAREVSGNYCEVARGLGLYSERVEQPDDIRPSLSRAIQATQSGKAALVEFITADELAFSNFLELSR